MILWYGAESSGWQAAGTGRVALAVAAYDLTAQTQYARGRASIGRQKALIEADLGLIDDARAFGGGRPGLRRMRTRSTAMPARREASSLPPTA